MTNYVDSDVKFDIRDDPLPKNSSQWPSTSSKYDCVLDALIIMLGTYKFDTKDDSSLQISSQEPVMFSTYGCILDALIIIVGSWKFGYNLGMKYYVDL